ncbi:hypothetical protein [Mycobacteroides abscessus]|uniref:Uncharacterized protein n=3 Tax=Mycobacteroides abscessus TaxID=36809 RepID=B1MMV9_MYCA9|nr:hypothetical protein [Mycobacteroides abscessus]ETZ88707.1 hypothetical protein L829_2277 [Mycobacteroides abscessus MAB_030201_1075]AKP57702.1 hypothetical protein MAUC22_08685 [Mycobacteroides abscessus UC22]ALM16078.1 hypothetical protein AOY11_07295 [Mycobacteroides abscessus]AMU20658.1 hypothetical protein A3N95_07450 [Mycobacteroides abscessus]AMU45165.1 hypothetical protein A3O00_07925 [Mycobacteroides abscessus]
MVSKFERNKDLAQEVVSSAAEHVGEIAKIITNAVVDVTRQIGEIATDAFEMREAAQRAEQDRSRHITDPDEDPAAH